MNIKAFFPESGRLCVRKTPDGVIIAGVIHFSGGFRPEEGTGYPIAVMGDGLAAFPLAGNPPQTFEVRSGASGWPEMQNWRLFEEVADSHYMFEARYIDVFRRSNGWAFVGLAKRDPFENALPEAHREPTHYWADIEQGGRLRAIGPPISRKLEGMGLGQILRDLCVWPDGDGELHTLPNNRRQDAPLMQIASKVSALRAAGRLSDDVAKALFQCEGLNDYRPYGREPEFDKYLAWMDRNSAIEVEGPRTQAEVDEQAARVKRAFEETMLLPEGLSYAVVGDGPRGRKIEFSPAATAENFKLACRMAIDLAKSLFEEELAVNFEAQGVDVQVVRSDDPEVQFALWERQVQARQLSSTASEPPGLDSVANSKTVRVRTSDATGTELDFAVGLCEGVKGLVLRDEALRHPPAPFGDEERYAPSIDWDRGGPIVGGHEIQFTKVGINNWKATIDLDEGDAMVEQRTGPTQLVAAMRCYVAAKLGNEFDLPREFVSKERPAHSGGKAEDSVFGPGS